MNKDLDPKVQKAKQHGYYISLDNKPIGSTYDPKKESHRIIDSILDSYKITNEKITKKYDSALFLGFSPVYHIHLLAPSLKHFIIFESRFSLNNNLANILKRYEDIGSDLLALIKEKGTVVSLDSNSYSPAHYLASFDLSRCIIVDQLFDTSKAVLEWKTELKQAIDERLKISNTENYYEKIWNKNTKKNLSISKYYFISDVLSKIKSNQPAVFISSGNSLSDSLLIIKNELKKNEFKKKTLFCVPGILPLLIKADILPDYIVATDASFYNAYHFYYLFYKKLNIPLICPFSISRNIPRQYPGKIYFYFDDIDVFTKSFTELKPEKKSLINKDFSWIKKNFISMDGSVSLSAVSLFHYLGYKDFYASGVDFSINPFRAHAESNTTEELLFSQGTKLTPFENRYHFLYLHLIEKVKIKNENKKNIEQWTEPKLSLYKNHFEKLLAEISVRQLDLPLLGE